MIGRFPWDPFPQGEPAPTGDDPLLAAIYRGTVEGADAYRAVRSALRRDAGVLRVGNRFVPDGRYREVAFVSVGHAALSMALAALHVFGDRLTQGFLAGPAAAPANFPFRSVAVPDGWGSAPAARETVEAAREISGSLRASDLFLLLLSPGALRALLLPPPGLDPTGFAELLQALAAHGATAAETVSVARVLGAGGVGGRLLPTRLDADVQCFLVDRGDGPVAVGGGPTYPLTEEERLRARSVLERSGLLGSLPPTAATPLAASAPGPAGLERRPVVVAAPEDGLRGAGDVVFAKGWTARVGALRVDGGPAEAAPSFLATVERVVGAERIGAGSRTKGLAVVAPMTLDVPEGVGERVACGEFLAVVRGELRRREMSVGLFRTAGPIGPAPDFAGAAVGAMTDGTPGASAAAVRPIRMPPGITDVGLLAVALLPTPAAPRGRGAG